MKNFLLKLVFGITVLSFNTLSIAQTYTFTNCAATGRTGPTQGQVNIAYASTTLAGNVTINTQGIQEWTVPFTGTYSIQAYGAQGGTGTTNGNVPGGLGASIYGEYNLTAGTVLKIVVGQKGEGISYGNSNAGGGGGGGSFVAYLNNTPIAVAGGGGGNGANNGVVNTQTHGSATTVPGISSWTNSVATGGSGGFGGYDGAGGGGYYTDGANSNTVGYGGQAFVNGALGGTYATVGSYPIGSHQGNGGFGCGGGVGHAGGGGGGYNGGNGTGQWGNGSWSGGGGSFNSGANQINTAGVNSGMGQVVITLLCNQLNLAVTPSDTVCFGTPVTITGTSTGSGTITWDNGITNGVSFPNNVAGVTTYSSSSTDPNDCPTTVTINVLPALTGSVTTTICNEDSVIVNGTTYNAGNPTGTEVISNVGPFNCDSTVTINLNVLPVLTGSVTTTICNDDSVVVNGTTYNSGNPTGTEVFTNVGPNNCDSTVTVNLNVLPALTGSVTDVLCDGDSVVVNGTTYNASNLTGTEVFTNVGPNNCDSTVTVNISVLAAKTGTVTTTICDGDSVVVNGTTYNSGNPTGTEIFTNVGPNNCDSTVTINLTVNPLPSVAIASFSPDTVCETDPAINLPVGTPASGTYSGNGVVGTTFDPNTAGVGVHYVVYSFTDSNSCANMDSTMIVVESCVGIDENGTLSGINIYPNPTNSIINITLGNISSDVNLTLTSVEGKIVYQENNVSDNKVSVDMSSNSKGIYFLKVEANNQYKVYKVVKE